MSLATKPCPLCATPLSQTRFAELQERVRREEAAKLDAVKRRFESDYAGKLKTETDAAVARGLQESRNQIEAGNSERVLMAERIGQLEAREATLSVQHSDAMQRQADKFKAELATAERRGQADAEKRFDSQLSAVRVQVADATRRTETLVAELAEARSGAERQAERSEEDVAAAEQRGQAAAEARLGSAVQLLRTEVSERLDEATKLRAELAANQEGMQQRVEALVKTRLDDAGREHDQALSALRDTLDQSHQRELQLVKASHFSDTSKLQEKVIDLNRQLEKKTANDLGDALEVDLLQALRDEFRTDDIRRIEKGEPGADVVHTVLHKGEVAGTIVIDSKNRQIFHYQFVDKLSADKLAARSVSE
jgi:hypothetical protein